jgi:uncharacterized Zn finger protein (UPF0148 family)
MFELNGTIFCSACVQHQPGYGYCEVDVVYVPSGTCAVCGENGVYSPEEEQKDMARGYTIVHSSEGSWIEPLG